MDVDDQFIDVAFDQQPEYVAGMLPETEFETFGAYEDVMEELPWNDIDAEIDAMDDNDDGGEWLVNRIFNQGREGSCVANACAQAHQIVQARQFGPDRVIDLSAISLYKRIGRSASSGAMVSDGLKEICGPGILPLDTPKNRELFGNAVMPNTGFNERFPPDWMLTAERLAGYEWHSVRTLKGLFTALINRLPVIVGREGHSICYMRPRRSGTNRTVDYPNSWNTTWGFALGNTEGGWGRDTAKQVEKSAKFAFVLRAVKSPALEAA